MNATDVSNSPDALLPYFEAHAEGRDPDDQFVRGVAIIRRWQALAGREPLDGAEFNRLVQILESEQDPGSGWFDLWGRIVVWGIAHRLIEGRGDPWVKP